MATQDIQKQITDIGGNVNTLQQAKNAGMQITPQTTVQEAQAYLSGQQPQQTTSQPKQSVVNQVNDISGLIGDVKYEENAFIPSYLRGLEADISASTNPADYRQNYINMFQDRINALNQIYDQQLSKAQHEGKGRVGSGTAILARRGLAGSPRGESIKEGVLEQNRGIESAIQSERALQIAAVMGEATQLAVQEAQEKRRAKESSTAQYIEYLKGEEERSGTRAGNVASLLLSQGIDINTLSQEEINQITQTAKLSPLQLKNAYNEAQAAQMAAEFEREGELLKRDKTQAEINQIDANMELDKQKFAEDVRRFGMEYALKARSQSLEEMKFQFSKSSDGGSPSGISPYQAERTKRTLQSVDELMGQVNKWTTGYGSLLKSVPESQAKSFDAQLKTLKSSIAFGELTAMREASKTGGALGQVSNIELGLLESALGALDQAQSAEQFKIQLNKIKNSINRWSEEVNQSSAGDNYSDEEAYSIYLKSQK